jgi:hypothetical protein
MAKKASKSGKAVSSLDVVNVQLQADFEGALNFEAELRAYEKAVRMLNSGEISVRGLKLTIEEASKAGSLPTIKPSTAQYFTASSKVRSLEGGKSKALKDVLNATIQAKRAFGKDFEAKVEGAKSFADLVKQTPKQGERAKAGRKSVKDAQGFESVDDLIEAFIVTAGEFEDITPKNPETWTKFLTIVEVMSKATRNSHPAGKAVKVA